MVDIPKISQERIMSIVARRVVDVLGNGSPCETIAGRGGDVFYHTQPTHAQLLLSLGLAAYPPNSCVVVMRAP